jgi:hypothetical protein
MCDCLIFVKLKGYFFLCCCSWWCRKLCTNWMVQIVSTCGRLLSNLSWKKFSQERGFVKRYCLRPTTFLRIPFLMSMYIHASVVRVCKCMCTCMCMCVNVWLFNIIAKAQLCSSDTHTCIYLRTWKCHMLRTCMSLTWLWLWLLKLQLWKCNCWLFKKFPQPRGKCECTCTRAVGKCLKSNYLLVLVVRK